MDQIQVEELNWSCLDHHVEIIIIRPKTKFDWRNFFLNFKYATIKNTSMKYYVYWLLI